MKSEFNEPHRVAIYFAPPTDSVLWNAGSKWLGRCAATNNPVQQPVVKSLTAAQLSELTAEPRRYGWHATLKAPFRLGDGASFRDVCDAMQALSKGREPFELPHLTASRMGQFLALRPMQTPLELERLAADCVKQLQPLARTLSKDDLDRRRRAGLTPDQDRLLTLWGYPYVLEHYRFHFSLTGPLTGLTAENLAHLLEAASDHFHVLPACQIDRISIFVEQTPGAPFRLIEQFCFQP
jgi:putative phosphonate metabolism protein